jgi:hypothetical protein
MTARPPYPPSMLTTSELSRARAYLEHKLSQPLSDARKQVLRDELKAVVGEQESRHKTTGLVPSAWSLTDG